MAALLQIQDLRTQFATSAGIVKAVDGVTYDVEEGETVAVFAFNLFGDALRDVLDPKLRSER